MKRLRPKHSDEELKRIYATPHRHDQWSDHKLRVSTTIQIGNWMINEFNYRRAADLSCGDGSILKGLGLPIESVVGDFAPGYEYEGPIEKTIHEIPPVDLFVLSETLEHLDDPLSVLKEIRKKTDGILLSTPLACWEDSNPEHYWAWDDKDIQQLLEDAKFKPVTYTLLHFKNYMYDYQIWGAI